MEGRYLSSDYIHVVNGVSKDNLTAYSGIEEAKAASFFARASYIFKDRYSISSSIRTSTGHLDLVLTNDGEPFPLLVHLGSFQKNHL